MPFTDTAQQSCAIRLCETKFESIMHAQFAQSSIPSVNVSIPPDFAPEDLEQLPMELTTAVVDFIRELDRSVRLRVNNIPPRPGHVRA